MHKPVHDRRRHVVWTSRAVVAFIGLGWLAAVPAVASVRSTEGWTLAQIETARALIAHVPDPIRPSCSFESLVNKPGGRPPDGVVADVRCRVSDSDAADTLNLLQFDTQAHLQAAYEDWLDNPLDTPRPEGCDGDSAYTVDGEHTGRSFCLPGADGNTIVYTHEPLLVLGLLNAPNGSSDVGGLVDYWNQSAGPSRDAGRIPSLLGDRAARKASNDLRKRIPAAIRKSCTADRESFVTPWIAARWNCERPSTGVYSAVYTSYRDRRGLDAAFDPDRLAATSESQNGECPATGKWRSGGKVRGRYACTVGSTTSTVSWSLDDRLISVVASNYDDSERSTKQLLDWWNNEAGPTV